MSVSTASEGIGYSCELVCPVLGPGDLGRGEGGAGYLGRSRAGYKLGGRRNTEGETGTAGIGTGARPGGKL